MNLFVKEKEYFDSELPGKNNESCSAKFQRLRENKRQCFTLCRVVLEQFSRASLSHFIIEINRLIYFSWAKMLIFAICIHKFIIYIC